MCIMYWSMLEKLLTVLTTVNCSGLTWIERYALYTVYCILIWILISIKCEGLCGEQLILHILMLLIVSREGRVILPIVW